MPASHRLPADHTPALGPDVAQRGAGERVALVLLLGVHALLAWLMRAPGLTTMNDDANYMILARALRAGAYADTHLVGSPPHSQYPPGYPAVLALLGAFFGEHYDLFLGWNVVASTAAIALLYALVRRRWPAWLALAMLTLTSLSPFNLSVAGTIQSEPTFLLLFSLTLWSLDDDRPGPVRTVLAPLLAVGAFLVRTAGLPFVAGVVAYRAIRGEWRRALISCALVVLPVAGWFAWSHSAQRLTSTRGYWVEAQGTGVPRQLSNSRLPPLVIRVGVNTKGYASAEFPTLAPFPFIQGTRIDNALWLLVTVVGIIGGALFLWRRWAAAAVLTAAYAAMLAVWVFFIPRFLLPILPILYLTLLLGWEAMSRRWLRKPALLPLALTVVLGTTAIWQLAVRLRDTRACEGKLPSPAAGCYTPEQASLFKAAADLRERAGPNEHAVAAKPATFGLLTGLQFVTPAAVASDPAAVRAQLDKYGIRYAYVGHLIDTEDDLARALASMCTALDLTAQYPADSYLFAVRDSAVGPADGRACAVLKSRLSSDRYRLSWPRW